ncbi:MAG: DUF4347 domain-containing protein, partial [Pseudomonas sp.]
MTRNLVFVDSHVVDYQMLISTFGADTQWVLLDADWDGVLQIQAAAAGYENLDSIQFISHGGPGSLYLGATVLDSSNLYQYENSLQVIGSTLTATGDILFYGCNVAQGDLGRHFIERLAQITGADVAAS